MKVVISTKNNIRCRELHYLLNRTYPNCDILVYRDVMLAVKSAIEDSADVLFADAEVVRFVKMIKKLQEHIIVVVLADNDSNVDDWKDIGINAFLVDPITQEMMIDSIEGRFNKSLNLQ